MRMNESKIVRVFKKKEKHVRNSVVKTFRNIATLVESSSYKSDAAEIIRAGWGKEVSKERKRCVYAQSQDKKQKRRKCF